MQTISYTALRNGLSGVMDKVAKNREVLYITRREHESMVIMTEEDYNATQETLYLLSNAKNAARLNESLKQAANNEFIEVDLS